MHGENLKLTEMIVDDI